MSDLPPVPGLPGKVLRSVAFRESIEVKFVVDPASRDPVEKIIVEHDEFPFEPPIDVFLELIRPGDRVLDVGAHLGTFALPAATIAGEVLAVEGHPGHVAALREAAVANGFHHLRVVNAVAVATSGTVRFSPYQAFGHVTIPPDNMAGLFLGYRPAGADGVALDDLLDEHGWDTVNVVKLDIEGSEAMAVEGLGRRLMGPDAPMVIFEANASMLKWYDSSTVALRRAFEVLGYRLFTIDRESGGKLRPTDSSELQVDTVTDYLAVKAMPAELAGRVIEPLTRQEVIERLIRAAGNAHNDYRAYTAGVVQTGPRWVRGDPRVQAMLATLRGDKERTVRDAAAWSGRRVERARLAWLRLWAR